MHKKNIETLEKERNLLVTGEFDATKKYTDDEFTELLATGKLTFMGVNHDERKQWLKDNGHEVTRDNMQNHDLTVAAPTDATG